MGWTKEYYMGAYIELEKKNEIIKELKYTYSNTNCEEYGKSKHDFENFCSRCSSEIGEIEFDREYTVGLYELTGLEEDLFHIRYFNDTIVLMPNFIDVEYIDTEKENTVTCIEESKIVNCKNSFIDFYGEAIEVIKQHYESVVVQFGLVTYYT